MWVVGGETWWLMDFHPLLIFISWCFDVVWVWRFCDLFILRLVFRFFMFSRLSSVLVLQVLFLTGAVFDSDEDNRSLNGKAVKIYLLGHWSQYWGRNKPGGIVEFFSFCGPRMAFSYELKIPIFSWDSSVNPLCNVLFSEFVLTQSLQAWWTSWISCWQICSNQVAGDDAL